MDSNTQRRLTKLLEWADIRSINDLNAETVNYLTFELEGRVPITQFRVRDHDYFLWRLAHPDIVDVEYDASTARVVIKATTSVLYDSALYRFKEWLAKWSQEINEDGSHGHYYCDTFVSKYLFPFLHRKEAC